MISVSYDFPKEDIARLDAAMRRGMEEFNFPMAQQVKAAGYSIGRALGTSTAVAKKRIELHPLKKRWARWNRLPVDWSEPKHFWGERYNQRGQVSIVFVSASGKAAAKRSKKAQVGRAGLAKKSWRASISGLGRPLATRGANNDERTNALAKEYAAKDRLLRGFNPSVRVGSFLDYAALALGRGEREVNDVARRAAVQMEKQLEHLAAKKLQERIDGK